MRKNLIINGGLVLVAVAIGVGAYANIGSGASTTAIRETVVTAKRGVVLSSVSSTGNVEATSDLSVSFQQTGKVTAIFVKPGDRVTAGQELAQIDDTQQQAALLSAQASLASAEANLAGVLRGETAVERAQDQVGLVSAAQSVTSAQSGLTHAQQSAAANLTKYQQQIDQAQSQIDSAESSLASAKSALDRAKSAMSTLQTSYDPNASSSEDPDALRQSLQARPSDVWRPQRYARLSHRRRCRLLPDRQPDLVRDGRANNRVVLYPGADDREHCAELADQRAAGAGGRQAAGPAGCGQRTEPAELGEHPVSVNAGRQCRKGTAGQTGERRPGARQCDIRTTTSDFRPAERGRDRPDRTRGGNRGLGVGHRRSILVRRWRRGVLECELE